jgi:hypothetical protein
MVAVVRIKQHHSADAAIVVTYCERVIDVLLPLSVSLPWVRIGFDQPRPRGPRAMGPVTPHRCLTYRYYTVYPA